MMIDAEIFRAAYAYGLVMSLIFVAKYVRFRGELRSFESVALSLLVVLPIVNFVVASSCLIIWVMTMIIEGRGRVIWRRKR
jgi:hypothetical protein